MSGFARHTSSAIQKYNNHLKFLYKTVMYKMVPIYNTSVLGFRYAILTVWNNIKPLRKRSGVVQLGARSAPILD
uniref:Uncharacterized protein n=1 Tax=Anguilla anguilla TaxID=7936 RepID=A0A0E9WEY8_ANGAN